MKKFLKPAYIFILGALLYVAAFILDFFVLGWPPQDPTPDMQMHRAELWAIHGYLERGAIVSLAAGVVWIVVSAVISAKSQRKH